MSSRRLSPLMVIEFRAYLDIERKEMADDLKISVEEYADIERGLQEPTQAQLSRIAAIFSCDPEILYGKQ